MALRDRLADIRTMRGLFTAAEAHARGMGELEPGPEHLLLAALDLDDGTARRAFGRVGADPDDLRAAIEAQHAAALRTVGVDVDNAGMDDRAPSPPPARGPLRTTGAAQMLFRGIVERVRAEDSRLLGAWIVLGSAETERGTVARALRHMGVDPADLAAAARQEIDASRRP